MNTEEILKLVSKQLGVTIKDAKPYDNVPDNSSLICNSEILQGRYDRSGDKAASAFHELGHFFNGAYEDYDPRSMMQMEAEAWKTGIKIAKSFGYEFDHEDIEHMIERLMSYEGK